MIFFEGPRLAPRAPVRGRADHFLQWNQACAPWRRFHADER